MPNSGKVAGECPYCGSSIGEYDERSETVDCSECGDPSPSNMFLP